MERTSRHVLFLVLFCSGAVELWYAIMKVTIKISSRPLKVICGLL